MVRSFMPRSIAALTATLALVAIVQPSTAGSSNTKLADNQIAVYYDDLNLQSTAGAATLLRRLQRAAETVCRDAAYIRTRPGARGIVRTCEEIAVKNAVASVDSPLVSALYNQRSGQAGLGKFVSR